MYLYFDVIIICPVSLSILPGFYLDHCGGLLFLALCTISIEAFINTYFNVISISPVSLFNSPRLALGPLRRVALSGPLHNFHKSFDLHLFWCNHNCNLSCSLLPSFHLDHCGGLPYFLKNTQFRGRVFMTHATKAIYRWNLSDYVKVRYVTSQKSATFQNIHGKFHESLVRILMWLILSYKTPYL